MALIAKNEKCYKIACVSFDDRLTKIALFIVDVTSVYCLAPPGPSRSVVPPTKRQG